MVQIGQHGPRYIRVIDRLLRSETATTFHADSGTPESWRTAIRRPLLSFVGTVKAYGDGAVSKW